MQSTVFSRPLATSCGAEVRERVALFLVRQTEVETQSQDVSVDPLLLPKLARSIAAHQSRRGCLSTRPEHIWSFGPSTMPDLGHRPEATP